MSEERKQKKKKKKGKSKLPLLLGLGAGGAFLILLCCGLGGGGVYFAAVSATKLGAPSVVGRWEGPIEGGPPRLIYHYTFRADGTGVEETLGNTFFNYSQTGDTLTILYTGADFGPGGFGMKGAPGEFIVNGRTGITFTAKRDGDSLTLIDTMTGNKFLLKKK